MAGEIRVVIVDDEYLERNLLKNCIDWRSLNMEIAGEAQDADEALGLIDRCGPDVIFTDIQMPGTDGIRLSELALQKHPGVKIVVLTGFDTFDYAQRSIKIGVSDFLLKPINGEEVLKTASGLRAQIERERKSRAESLALKQQLYDNLPYLRERFFNELLGGIADGEAFGERMAFLGIRFSGTSFQVAAFEPVPEDGRTDEEARFLLSLQITNSLSGYFGDSEGVFVFMNTTNRIIVLNSDETLDLYEQCVLLRRKLAREIPCSVCVGLGSLKRGAEKIVSSYREALTAIRYRVAVGNDAVILYDSIRLPGQDPPCDWNELYGQLDFSIKAGLAEKADEAVDRIFGNIDLKDAQAVKSIRMAAMNVALAFFRTLTEAGLGPAEIYRLEVRVSSRIFSLGTLPEIKALLSGTARECIDSVGRHQSSRVGGLIDDIRAYVGKHYADSGLSLTELAKTFFFNPSYLSRMFKKKAGVSFTEYLTEVRMEKALELLREKNLKAFEIAAAVGIPDPNYFSTCFKKYTGVSISEFRRSLGVRVV